MKFEQFSPTDNDVFVEYSSHGHWLNRPYVSPRRQKRRPTPIPSRYSLTFVESNVAKPIVFNISISSSVFPCNSDAKKKDDDGSLKIRFTYDQRFVVPVQDVCQRLYFQMLLVMVNGISIVNTVLLVDPISGDIDLDVVDRDLLVIGIDFVVDYLLKLADHLDDIDCYSSQDIDLNRMEMMSKGNEWKEFTSWTSTTTSWHHSKQKKGKSFERENCLFFLLIGQSSSPIVSRSTSASIELLNYITLDAFERK